MINTIAVIFGIYFLVISLTLHFLKKEVSYAKTPISNYVIGKYGFLMTLAFWLIGVNQLIISYNFYKLNYMIPAIFIGLAGIGVIIVGFTRVESIDKLKGVKLHEIGAAMQFLFFSIAAIIYGFSNELKIFSIIIGIFTFFLLLIMAKLYIKYRRKTINNYALFQKINTFLINIWLIIIPCLFSR